MQLHYRKGDIEALEKVLKIATKNVPALRHLPHNARLKACNLTILHFRRIRSDMIETYKILTGKCDGAAVGLPTVVQACLWGLPRVSPSLIVCNHRK